MTTSRVRAIDSHLPTFDVRSAHQIEVNASAEDTYRAARQLDLARSLPIAALFAIRGIPHVLSGKARLTRTLTLDTMFELGFVMLEESPTEVVVGSIGKFWRPDSGMVPISPEGFATFDEPGYSKGIMSFTVDELGPDRSLFATETRVLCTDDASRRKFSMYWRVIGPFSGLIRHAMLNQVKRSAEGR